MAQLPEVSKIKLEDPHPLELILPESWNNIPICLVKSTKQIIEHLVKHDQKFKVHLMAIEQQKKKDLNTMTRIEKDLNRKEEALL